MKIHPFLYLSPGKYLPQSNNFPATVRFRRSDLQMQSLSLISRSHHPPVRFPPLTSSCNRRFPAHPAQIRLRPCRLVTPCASGPAESSPTRISSGDSHPSKPSFGDQQSEWSVQVGSPIVAPLRTVAKLSLSDQAFFLLAFIACTVIDPVHKNRIFRLRLIMKSF